MCFLSILALISSQFHQEAEFEVEIGVQSTGTRTGKVIYQYSLDY